MRDRPQRVRCASDDAAAAATAERAAADDISCVGTGTEVECVLPEPPPGAPPPGPPPPLDALALALLVLPFFLWGTSMVCMKQVLPHTSPLFVAAVRLLPSGAALVGYAAARGRAQPSGAAAWAAIAAFGLVDATLFQGCLAQGLTRTSAGLGSVIIDSQPITVALLAAALFGERVSLTAAAGLLLGVAGLLVLELPAGGGAGGAGGAGEAAAASAALFSSAPLWERGEWWMLLAAQAMAVGTVMVRGVVALGVDPVMATGWHMCLGGAPLLALSLATEPELYARLGAEGLPAADVASLGYASLLGGAVAYGAFFNAAASGSLLRLSSLTFLTPVFAAAAGFLALGETLTPQQLLGAGITLAGISLVSGHKGDAAPGDSSSAADGSRRE